MNNKQKNENDATNEKSKQSNPDIEQNANSLDKPPKEKDHVNEESDKENLSLNENSQNDKDSDDDLKKEIEELKEEKLRLLADMENLRKRSDKEKIDSIRYGSINFARDMLSPNDNLSRALESINSEEKIPSQIINLLDGIKMVKKEIMTILEKHGVKKIDAINKKFDHNFHQAILEVETEKQEEGLVVQEIQTGFTMHDRLLRASMVGVSKKPKNTKKEEKKE